MNEYSLDAEGNVIGPHATCTVNDITEDKGGRNTPKVPLGQTNSAAGGKIQLGKTALWVKGQKYPKEASITWNYADIRRVEFWEKNPSKKLSYSSVVITLYDGRIYKIILSPLSFSPLKLNEAFMLFFYPVLHERVTQANLERQKTEDAQRREQAKADEAKLIQERDQNAALEPARIEKLKKLVQVSKKLKIAQIAQILDLSEQGVYDRIVDWAARFGFTLDVDVVEFGAGRKDDFIASLDAAFKDWGKKVDIKTGKV